MSILYALLDNGFKVIGFEKDSKGNTNREFTEDDREFTEDDIDVYQHYNNPTFIAKDSAVMLYFLIYINKKLINIDINIIEEIIKVMEKATNDRYDADLVGYFNKELKIKVNIMKLPFEKIYY